MPMPASTCMPANYHSNIPLRMKSLKSSPPCLKISCGGFLRKKLVEFFTAETQRARSCAEVFSLRLCVSAVHDLRSSVLRSPYSLNLSPYGLPILPSSSSIPIMPLALKYSRPSRKSSIPGTLSIRS